jgi:carbon-monoxide dehydrogenase medium subunit
VKPIKFQYERPESLDEALATVGSFGSFARPLAGGQSLVPMLNMRLVQPAVVVDINGLTDELDHIRSWDGGIEVGSLARYSQLETSPEIRERIPVLAHLVAFIGDRQVRNRGTLGGSAAQADPTGEVPLCCVTLGARIVVTSAERGLREVPAAEFFEGAYTPALAEDELVVAVRFPRPPERFAFTEVGRKHNDFALLSVLVAATPEGPGRWRDVCIGLAGLADRPLAVPEAGRLLDAERWDEELIEAATEAALRVIEPSDDLRASAEYRRHLLAIKLRRTIKRVQSDAAGG